MNSLKIILLAIISTVVLVGCQDTKITTGYSIQGYLKGTPNGTKIYLFNMEKQSSIDSAYIHENKFTLDGKIDYPTRCVLMIPDDAKYADLIVENGDIVFESTFEDMYFKSKITGGPEQKLKNDLWELTGAYDTKYLKIGDSLSNKLYRDENHKKELIKKHRTYVSKSKELMWDFIVKNPNSYFTLDLLFRNRESISKSTLKETLKKLELPFKNIPNAIALNEYIQGLEAVLKKGDLFNDFDAVTLNDEPFKLSSFKGDYIYLSFWSRTCKPCREENRFLSKNFEALPKTLKIVSFSTDKNKKSWKLASSEDNIKWTNVSAFGKRNDSIAKLYNVQALPVSFLIHKDGRILEKFFGFDSNLYSKILNLIAENESE